MQVFSPLDNPAKFILQFDNCVKRHLAETFDVQLWTRKIFLPAQCRHFAIQNVDLLEWMIPYLSIVKKKALRFLIEKNDFILIQNHEKWNSLPKFKSESAKIYPPLKLIPLDDPYLLNPITFVGVARPPNFLLSYLLSKISNLFPKEIRKQRPADELEIVLSNFSSGKEWDIFLFELSELSEIDLDLVMSTNSEAIAFFINLFNLLMIHLTCLSVKRKDMNLYKYRVGCVVLGLDDIENGILRGSLSKKNSVFKKANDMRVKYIIPLLDSRIHFCLSHLTLSSPVVRIYHSFFLEEEFERNIDEFLTNHLVLSLKGKMNAVLPKWMEKYHSDFNCGKNLEILMYFSKFIQNENRITKLVDFYKENKNDGVLKYQETGNDLHPIIVIPDKIPENSAPRKVLNNLFRNTEDLLG